MAPSPENPAAPAVDTDGATLVAGIAAVAQALNPLAGTASGVTRRAPASGISPVDPVSRPLRGAAFINRYQVQQLIGQGGMGEVRSCADERIGRDVAIKLIRPGHGSDSDLRSRFTREARIQGQLEHPSIVPVYDLAEREDGTAYFTMKRIHGRTLEDIIDGLRGGDADTIKAYSRRRLLTAFSNLCLAVAFAHVRGVVHRDIKPANIILGEFGEVYLLDWGVAKVLGSSETELDAQSSGPTPGSGARLDVELQQTAPGAVLGTPGYMAPEQLRGDQDAIDHRADIYALGAVLFEILSFEPLHARDNVQALVSSTLQGTDARPSARVADAEVAPELDDICVRATARVHEERYATARQMHDELERYLDGDRDLARRREMAQERLSAAQHAWKVSTTDASQSVSERAHAMRELNAALTLDPVNQDALALMVRALTENVDQLPAEAERELEETRAATRRRSGAVAALGFLSCFLLDPLMLLLGVRSHWTLLPCGFFVIAAAAYVWWLARNGKLTSGRAAIMALLAAGVAGSTSVFFGPFVLAPGIAVAAALPMIVNTRASHGRRAVIMAAAAFAVLAPALMQWIGWLPPSYRFEHGVISILPWAVNFPPTAALAFLAAASIAVVAVPIAIVGRSVDALSTAERRLFAQAWMLRQVIPEMARGAAKAGLSTSADEEPACNDCIVSAALGSKRPSPAP